MKAKPTAELRDWASHYAFMSNISWPKFEEIVAHLESQQMDDKEEIIRLSMLMKAQRMIIQRIKEDACDSLAVVAYRHGYGVSYYVGELSMSGAPHQYNIALTHGQGRHPMHLVSGRTYAEAEARAAEYLASITAKVAK